MERREENKRGNEGGQSRAEHLEKRQGLAHLGKLVEMERREENKRGNEGGQSRAEHLEKRHKAGTSRHKIGGNGEERRKQERK